MRNDLGLEGEGGGYSPTKTKLKTSGEYNVRGEIATEIEKLIN